MKRLKLIPDNLNINFIGISPITFLFTLLITGISLGALTFKGINYGIDFKGGHIFEVRLHKAPDIAALRTQLSPLGDVAIQEFGGSNELLIKVEQIEKNTQEDQNKVTESVKNILGPEVDYRKIETVGPKVGEELIKNGLYAIGISLLIMLIYMLIRFPWAFSLSAITALIYDCVCVLGFFSLFSVEFNETALIAILITAGYSINDTIVIFDRIRENLRRFKTKSIKEIINNSVNETLSRTLITSGTTLLALFALYFCGGRVIANFSLPIIIGITSGTISSIFLAAPFLLIFPHLTIERIEENSKQNSLV